MTEPPDIEIADQHFVNLSFKLQKQLVRKPGEEHNKK